MHTAELTTASTGAKRQPITESPVSSTIQSGTTSTEPRGKQPTNKVLRLIIANNGTTDGGHYMAVKISAKRYL